MSQMRKYVRCGWSIALILGVVFGMKQSCHGAIELPDPGTIIDGNPVAILYDDFYSYSVPVLEYLIPGFDIDSAGTGNIPIKVLTGAQGATNPTPLPNPVLMTSSDESVEGVFEGFTVGELFSVLGDCTPVFTFDFAEPGNDPGLLGNGYVELIVGSDTYQYAFDSNAQPGVGIYDPDAFITVPEEFVLADGTGVNSNLGGGKFDFVFYSPELAQQLIGLKNSAPDTQISIGFHLKELAGSFEEIGIICATIEAIPEPMIPEPSAVFVWGGIFLCVGGTSMFRRRKIQT